MPVIRASLEALKIEPSQAPGLFLDFPADNRFGDLSTNIALRLSKPLQKPAVEIANQIVEAIKVNLKQSQAADFIKEVKVAGAGFINFYLSEKYFYLQLLDLAVSGKEALKSVAGKNKRVLIEFVSANPTGSLSVAHARQAAVGDSLANILNFLGFEVKREYYLNDEGNQINILGKSVELRLKELEGEKIEFPENYYQGDYIYEIAKVAKSKKVRTEDLGDFAADYILSIIKQELHDFGISFDCWYSQKELRTSGKIDKALSFLKEKEFLYEEGGALWFKSSAFGDDKDRVIIKSDSSYTYLAPDIAYHEEKFKRGFNWLINLWGPDHHGYINRLKASVQAFGHDKDCLSVIIVQLATIFRDGKSIEMSTRRGQYITLREVLDEVGRDAARYFFLMRRTSSHLDFDLEVAKKQTSENPVYYVQYAYARICNILQNSTQAIAQDTDLSVLTEKEELDLLKKALQFQPVLISCLSTQDPYLLTVYMQELAEAFHRFYDKHRVLSQPEAVTKARLCLIQGIKVIISAGLELLGVSCPEKM